MSRMSRKSESFIRVFKSFIGRVRGRRTGRRAERRSEGRGRRAVPNGRATGPRPTCAAPARIPVVPKRRLFGARLQQWRFADTFFWRKPGTHGVSPRSFWGKRRARRRRTGRRRTGHSFRPARVSPSASFPHPCLRAPHPSPLSPPSLLLLLFRPPSLPPAVFVFVVRKQVRCTCGKKVLYV